jgi:hypothetical protein
MESAESFDDHDLGLPMIFTDLAMTPTPTRAAPASQISNTGICPPEGAR